MANAEPWTLRGFDDHIVSWIDSESPPPEVVDRVVRWIEARAVQPYVGVKREPGFPNLWSGEIPGTVHAGHNVAFCSYWIAEIEHEVRCDQVSTLPWPV